MSEIKRILKDGYWDRTAVVQAGDGSLRVRKESKPVEDPWPWAKASLRREIAYMKEIMDGDASGWFPGILDSWDDGGEEIGYEMEFFENHQSVADLVLAGEMSQATADEMQRALSEVILYRVHRQIENGEASARFWTHITDVIENSIEEVGRTGPLRDIFNEPSVRINGQEVPGLKQSMAQLKDQAGHLARLASVPAVRLHGDLILENILWTPLLLIDPVSVAGLAAGHPLFDLVKYESFSSGELFAIREEIVTAEQGSEPGSYIFEIPREHPRLLPFRRLDLTKIFRAGFVSKYGEIDPVIYHLIDAYFSLVMARNTGGIHQRARILKACECLARVLGSSGLSGN